MRDEEGPTSVSPDHVVELYDSDENFPARAIAQHLADGLRLGEAAIVIATAEHARRISAALSEELPADDAVWQRFRSIDAAIALAREDFTQFVDEIMDAAAAGAPRIRLYGEGVDLLCRDGKHERALE